MGKRRHKKRKVKAFIPRRPVAQVCNKTHKTLKDYNRRREKKNWRKYYGD